MISPVRFFSCAALGAAALAITAGAGAAQPASLDGATLFKQNCSACHQPQGQGIPGAFPALAGDAFVQGEPAAVAALLLKGRGGMPNFSDDLTSDEIASVLSFVRQAWGNRAAPIPASLVVRARGGQAPTDQAPSVLPYH